MDSIAARDEAEVAVNVVATRGNLIVGRAQVYDGDGRLGYSMTLASPALRSQWWFANGAKGAGVTERFSIYNPTDDDVEVTPVFLGIPEGTDVLVEPIVVPARQVVTYTPATVQGLPDGRHAVVFGTTDFSQSIVVERAITRTIEGIPTTSVLLGGLSRAEDGYVPNTWTLAVGPGEPTEDALVVYNTTSADATVTVQAVTPDGVVTVPSLAEVALPGGGARHDPAHRPGGASTASSSSARRRRCSSSARCPASRAPRAAARRGPSRWSAERGPGCSSPLAIVAVAVAVGARSPAAGARTRRRSPAAPCRRSSTGPTSPAPTPPWLVAVFTSATCQHVRRRRPQGGGAGQRRGRRGRGRVQRQPRPPRRYGIDAVPILVIADVDGVVRRHFVGPVSATDLWAAVAAARDDDVPPS